MLQQASLDGTAPRRKPLVIVAVASLIAFIAIMCMLGPRSSMLATSSPQVTFKQPAKPAVNLRQGVSGQTFIGAPIRTYRRQQRFTDGLASSELPVSRRNTINSLKWAVCTTIHSPTEAIIDFAEQGGDWAVVVVGDKGMAPFEITGANMVFLDVDAQQAMAEEYKELFDLLPWKHFGRKNVGYLYAILHGAEEVWDFDDDNYLKNHAFPTVPDASDILNIVIEGECDAFNPLPYMGGDGPPNPMWPRGFPLNLIHTPCNFTVAQGDPSKNAIYQSLADNQPDVDAIYRLTRTTPMQFRRKAGAEREPTLSLPRGAFSPYNAQATLVMKPALWSLLLPVTVHGRVSDIWRSYIAQRLLWDVGLNIAFTPPVVDQYRNAHNYLADMQAEEDLYFKAPALLALLQEWKGKARTLPGRYEELMIALYERSYLEEEDVLLVQEWLAALGRIGYEFPSILGPTDEDKERP